jgi:hypothetical protein
MFLQQKYTAEQLTQLSKSDLVILQNAELSDQNIVSNAFTQKLIVDANRFSEEDSHFAKLTNSNRRKENFQLALQSFGDAEILNFFRNKSLKQRRQEVVKNSSLGFCEYDLFLEKKVSLLKDVHEAYCRQILRKYPVHTSSFFLEKKILKTLFQFDFFPIFSENKKISKKSQALNTPAQGQPQPTVFQVLQNVPKTETGAELSKKAEYVDDFFSNEPENAFVGTILSRLDELPKLVELSYIEELSEKEKDKTSVLEKVRICPLLCVIFI